MVDRCGGSPALRSEVILALADHQYDAAIAGFSFTMRVDDPTASWHLEIECGTQGEPRLSDYGVVARHPKLHRVGGFAVADGLTGALEFEEPAFTLYQHDHLMVENVTMRVGDLVSHGVEFRLTGTCLLYTSPSPRD